MTFFTGFAIYFVIWWVTLFMVLPHGNQSQAEAGSIQPGTEPAAPVNARLGTKLLLNSLLAGFVFAIYWIVTGTLGYSLDDIPSILPEHLQFKDAS